MSGDNSGSPNRSDLTPDELSQLLELELIQKRAQWQKVSLRRNSLRSVSIFFLFVMIVGTLAVFYFAFSRANEVRQQQSPQAANAAAQR